MSCGQTACPAAVPDAALHRLLSLDFLSPAASCGTSSSSSSAAASPQSVFANRGLVNLANRCFLLSSLQCLLAAPPVRRFLTQCTRGLQADRDAASLQQLATTAPVHAELLLFLMSYRGSGSSQAELSDAAASPLPPPHSRRPLCRPPLSRRPLLPQLTPPLPLRPPPAALLAGDGAGGMVRQARLSRLPLLPLLPPPCRPLQPCPCHCRWDLLLL